MLFLIILFLILHLGFSFDIETSSIIVGIVFILLTFIEIFCYNEKESNVEKEIKGLRREVARLNTPQKIHVKIEKDSSINTSGFRSVFLGEDIRKDK